MKAGSASSIAIPVGLITAGLTLYSPWLIPVAAMLDGFVLDLSQTCTSDPPLQPVFTLDDAKSIPGGVLNPGFAALMSKVQQLVQYYFWFQFCECVPPVATPARTPAPLPPPGFEVLPSTGGVACGGGTFTGPIIHGPISDPGDPSSNLTRALLPIGQGAPILPTSVTSGVFAYPVAPGVTHIEWQSANVAHTLCPTLPYQYASLFFFNATADAIGGATLAGTAGTTGVVTGGVDVDPRTRFYSIILMSDTLGCGDPTGPAYLSVQAWCGGSSPGTPQNCCPPDPALLNLLHQTYEMTQLILASQRPAAHTYLDRLAHPALTGNGSFVLQAGVIAVRVNITAGLPVTRLYLGNPNYYFDVGFITPTAVSSALKGSRVVYSKQTIPLPAAADSISWQFPTGVVATITELVAGP